MFEVPSHHHQEQEEGEVSMRHKPEHTCFKGFDCPGCAFELGQALATKKPTKSAKYVWMVVGSHNPCDIRRYSFTHARAVDQLSHTKNFKDCSGPGTWRLFKLVAVDREKAVTK